MKLSNETKDVLKNFAQINQNLVVQPGNILKTISVAKNVMATVEINETFDKEFAIYDLNGFLSAISLFKDPDLVFGDTEVVISDNDRQLKYTYADPSVVISPKNNITMPDVDVEFTLPEEAFASLQKASSVLGVTDLVLSVNEDGTGKLRITEKGNATSNEYSVTVTCDSSAAGDYAFKVENLKLLPSDYKVQLTKKGFSRFESNSSNLEYFIALEAA